MKHPETARVYYPGLEEKPRILEGRPAEQHYFVRDYRYQEVNWRSHLGDLFDTALTREDFRNCAVSVFRR